MKFKPTYFLTALVPIGLIAMIVYGGVNSVREERLSRQDPERLAYEALVRDKGQLQQMVLRPETAKAISAFSSGGVMHYRGDFMAAKEYGIVCLSAMKVDEGVPVFVRLEKGQITTIRNQVVTNIMASQLPCRSLGQ